MPEIKISIQPSFSQVAQAFMRQDIRGFLAKEVNRLAASVERFSKQLTPVATGRLRASIGFTPAKLFPQTVVKTGTSYAIYVHEGTRFMRARPFMKEGARLGQMFIGGQIAPRLDKAIADNFKKIAGTGVLKI